MKKSVLFLILLFPFFVMCQNSNKKAEIALVFPVDTIPMQYNSRRLPILDGIVNDSLQLKVFFDTGTWGNKFSISDSLTHIAASRSQRIKNRQKFSKFQLILEG